MNLSDKVAIVTGGGQGIGKAIALRLAREGADVVVCGRREESLRETSGAIQALKPRSRAIVADVSDEEQVDAMVRQMRAEFGHIDILVNNAGIAGPTAPATSISRAAWDEVLAINLTGAFLCARAVLPDMIERRSGKIINISSVAGRMAYALRSPYAVSKWGLIGMTRTLAQEVGQYHIQVNAIVPGPTAGARMQSVIENRAKELGRPAEDVEHLFVEGTALKRMVDPEHVAALVAFLASSEGDSITGEAIDVSAGYAL
jgi:NAD(P)-dependent dehydrogenase (short-subunit alcohol dehydrogenase family)